ncbi:MAG: tyrosine-type recombinase/integrase, partial [Victivallales bacterium]|nr:tyrosine-type recombinase/integrase [Victivallales bacterium]
MKLVRRGKYWVVSVKGKRISTGMTKRKDAMEYARSRFAAVIAADERDKLKIAAVVEGRVMEDAMMSVLLPDMWDKFPHSSERRDLKASTVKEAERNVRRFAAFAGSKGCRTAGDVTKEIAKDYLDMLPPRSRVVNHCNLRALFERMGASSDSNPFGFPVRKPQRSESVHREPLTADEVRRLLETADGLSKWSGNRSPDAAEFAVFLRFLVYTGLRLSDAATAPLSSLDMDAGMVSRLVTAKTGAVVRFPVHPALMARLRLMLEARGEPSPYIFPSMAERAMHGNSLTHWVRRVMRTAKI